MDVNRIAIAIAHAEGFYVKGAIPQLANNPGDLKLGDVGYGTLGEGITVFQTSDLGWNALFHQVGKMLAGKSPYYHLTMTLAEVGMKYSGSPDWAKNVASALGVAETITLGELDAVSENKSWPLG